MDALRHYLLALQFFTRIPINGRLAAWVGYSPAMLNASAGHFPGVGWFVGIVASGILLLALTLLPVGVAGALVAAGLSTVATVWLTGAFHEDGLADTTDGLGGSTRRERALQIMKDSRLGSYGAIALVLALGLKVLLLALLIQEGALPAAAALVGAHVLSRWAPLVVMRSLPYVSAPQESKSKPLAEAVSGLGLWVGSLWTLPVLPLLWWHWGLGHLLLALILWAGALTWFLRLLSRRLQGFTGDTLGAAQQLCELALYLGLVLQWPW